MNPEDNRAAYSEPSQVQVSPVKLGKFRASYMIVGESWNILKKDRELAWFPVLSAVTSIIALMIIGAVFFFTAMGGDLASVESYEENGVSLSSYLFVFVYYLIMFFITNYFLAGIYTIVNGRFKGQDLSFSDGINGANNNFQKIFLWSLISATVGVILKIISDRSQIVGKIVAALFGAAWGILTYFSLPSLIIGQKSVTESFKESASLIRRTWGETIIVNFGAGLFFGGIVFFGFVLYVGIMILIPSKLVFISATILFVLFMIALSIISSTLNTIFNLALYEFALTGQVPAGFTPDLIKGAIKTGK